MGTEGYRVKNRKFLFMTPILLSVERVNETTFAIVFKPRCQFRVTEESKTSFKGK